MGKNSGIEWTTHTFNPWIGCTRISPACDHCYAADWDKRYHGGEHWGSGAPRRRTSIDNWRQPRKWARQARETGTRPRVFCCSLADVFDNQVPASWREDLWHLIRATPELDWLLLSKRIGNVRQMLPQDWGDGWPHVWLGITVVTQAEADRDIPKLLDVPAALRFLSCEPLLEEIRFRPYSLTERPCPACWCEDELGEPRGTMSHPINCGWRKDEGTARGGIDWVIAGGESGQHARPMHPDWARSLRDQCAAEGVPFLFKQWGEWGPAPSGLATHVIEPPGRCVLRLGCPLDAINEAGGELIYRYGKKRAGRLLDGRQHDEIPRSAVPYMCPNDNGPSVGGAVSP